MSSIFDFLGTVGLLMNFGQAVGWISIACFAMAIAVLSVFDISLPRGDVVGVSGALDAVALVVLGPAAAAACCAIGVTLAYALRRAAHGHHHLATTLISRFAGLAAAALVVQPLRHTMANGLHWWIVTFLGVSLYLGFELIIAQSLMAMRTGRSLTRLVRGNLDRQAPVLLAQLSAAVLAASVYGPMGEWSLLLVVALLLLIRQSYSLLLDIGETYRTTVGVLVQAAEGVGTDFHGHAERSAHVAREIAMGCGLPPREVERISYAALLHDIGALSAGSESVNVQNAASSVLEGVVFFEDVIEILRVCDGIRSTSDTLRESDLLAAFIVALSSDVDAGTHPCIQLGRTQAAVQRVAPLVPRRLKARAVSAAIHLGYSVPAVA